MKTFLIIAAIVVLAIIGIFWKQNYDYEREQSLVRAQTELSEHIAQQNHEIWQGRVELAGAVWHYQSPYATYKLCVFKKENEGPDWPNKLCARLDKELDRATTQTPAQKKAWKEAR